MGTEAALPVIQEYARIRTEMKGSAWLYGTVTTKEFTGNRKPDLREGASFVPPGDYVADNRALLYYVSVEYWQERKNWITSWRKESYIRFLASEPFLFAEADRYASFTIKATGFTRKPLRGFLFYDECRNTAGSSRMPGRERQAEEGRKTAIYKVYKLFSILLDGC